MPLSINVMTDEYETSHSTQSEENTSVNIDGNLISFNWNCPQLGACVSRRVKVISTSDNIYSSIDIGDILILYSDENGISVSNDTGVLGYISHEAQFFSSMKKTLDSKYFWGFARIDALPSTGNIIVSIRIIPKQKYIFTPNYSILEQKNEKGKLPADIAKELTLNKKLVLSIKDRKIFIGTKKDGIFAEILSDDNSKIISYCERGINYSAKRSKLCKDDEVYIHFEIV